MELYLHSPTTPSWRGAQLKHCLVIRDYPSTSFDALLSVVRTASLNILIVEPSIERPISQLNYTGFGWLSFLSRITKAVTVQRLEICPPLPLIVLSPQDRSIKSSKNLAMVFQEDFRLHPSTCRSFISPLPYIITL
jgi:hypothetical protein